MTYFLQEKLSNFHFGMFGFIDFFFINEKFRFGVIDLRKISFFGKNLYSVFFFLKFVGFGILLPQSVR